MAHYSVEVSEASDGAGASQAEPEWRTLLDKAPTNSLHFRGESGDAYRYRITATDRALNSASIVTDPVLIPVDDRDRGLWEAVARLEAHPPVRPPGAAPSCARRSTGATGRLRFTGPLGYRWSDASPPTAAACA